MIEMILATFMFLLSAICLLKYDFQAAFISTIAAMIANMGLLSYKVTKYGSIVLNVNETVYMGLMPMVAFIVLGLFTVIMFKFEE